MVSSLSRLIKVKSSLLQTCKCLKQKSINTGIIQTTFSAGLPSTAKQGVVLQIARGLVRGPPSGRERAGRHSAPENQLC